MELLRSASRIICFWVGLSGTLVLHAQHTTWSAGTSLGYALPHRSEMLAIVTGHSHGFAFRLGNRDSAGWRENWSQHGPVWQGIQMAWLDGGSVELGKFASVMWMVELPIRSRWNLELGTGMGWCSAPYDPVERPLSIAIGTRWNAGIHLGTSVQLVQRQEGWIALGAGLTHFSNGALALPNLGVNNLHLRISAGRTTEHIAKNRNAAVAAQPVKGWLWAIAGRAGARDINLPGGTLHPTVSAGAYAQRITKDSHSWTLALDLAQNNSLQQFSSTQLSAAERLQLATLVGINLHFGRAHLMLLQGWVWTRADQALGRRHLQAILAYEINPNWAIEWGLRSFRLRADYPFIGIRYRIGHQIG